MSHLDKHNILTDVQHGFRKSHSCETQLITTIEEIARNLDQGSQTDAILLDFSKAFDTVPHQRLLLKLDRYGLWGEIKGWIQAWLCDRKQTVVVDGDKSAPVKVKSGVPQGTVLGPLMFLLYINDIGDNIDSQIRLFAETTILYTVIKGMGDASLLQKDLDKMIDWCNQWQMSFNNDKCKVLRIYRSLHPVVHQYTLDGTVLESVHHHPYLGIELTSNLN